MFGRLNLAPIFGKLDRVLHRMDRLADDMTTIINQVDDAIERIDRLYHLYEQLAPLLHLVDTTPDEETP